MKETLFFALKFPSSIEKKRGDMRMITMTIESFILDKV